ncbi:hypothetical protein VPH5P1C_0151 [Vibrio phage 5P1c]
MIGYGITHTTYRLLGRVFDDVIIDTYITAFLPLLNL